MERQRRKDYQKVIANNDLIDKIYSRLAELEINGEQNNEEYINLVEIIKKYALINERIVKKYSLTDGELQNYLNSLPTENHDRDLSNEYDLSLDIMKNVRFIDYFMSEGTFYEDEALKEDFINNVIAMNLNGVNYNLEDAKRILVESYGYDEEEAQDFIDKTIDRYLNSDDNLLDKENEIANRTRIITYNQQSLQMHTLMTYMLDAIEKEQNKNVKKLLIKYKYKFICGNKCLEDFFLQNPNNFTRIDFYQKRILEEIKNSDSEDYKDAFIETWDVYYLELIEDIISQIILLDESKKNNTKAQALKVVLNCDLKTFSSLLLKDKYQKMLNSYDLQAINIVNNEDSKKLLLDSKNLKKNLVLSEKFKNM